MLEYRQGMKFAYTVVPTLDLIAGLNRISDQLGWGTLRQHSCVWNDPDYPGFGGVAFSWESRKHGGAYLMVSPFGKLSPMDHAEVRQESNPWSGFDLAVLAHKHRIQAGPICFSLPRSDSALDRLAKSLATVAAKTCFSTAVARRRLLQKFPEFRMSSDESVLYSARNGVWKVVRGKIVHREYR